MITYNKSYWGLPLLFRIYGSAFPRTWPFALLSGIITLILEYTVARDTVKANGELDSTARDWWGHPYPYQTFAFIVGFMLVFRSNFGYSRYWEGRTNLQMMSSRWSDAVIQTLNFDFGTLPLDLDEDGKRKAKKFGDTFVHLVSLLHGIAIQNLRRDWDLGNLQCHSQNQPEPPVDAKHLNTNSGDNSVRFSWRDISQLRSDPKHRVKYNKLMPILVIGGLTTDEFKSLGSSVEEDTLGGISRGCKLSTGVIIPGPAERVQVVMSWIHQILAERKREGGLNIEAPIMTRIYQVLADGMLGFEQCRKLMDTPFPFPWVQFVTVCLLLYTLTVPIVISSYISEPWLAFMLTFFTVMTYYALNEVARDLEDPFVYDPNDLPMSRHQFTFNERILALSGTQRPISPMEIGLVRLRRILQIDNNLQMSMGDEILQSQADTIKSRIGGRAPMVPLFNDDSVYVSGSSGTEHNDSNENNEEINLTDSS